MTDGGAKVIVGRLLVLSALALAGVGVMVLFDAMPFPVGSPMLLGSALLVAAAVDALIGLRFLVSHSR